MIVQIQKLYLLVFLTLLVACAGDKTTLLVLKESSETGIDFSNTLTESAQLNYFTYPYMYLGAGVGVGDFNNDGLEDIYFVGNQVSNRLYLNLGDFQFEDISEISGTKGDQRWYSGVSVVDINQDGWQDIYLSVSGPFRQRVNQLYVNNGDLTFTESAAKYGIDDGGFSHQGTFFDYDLDGDLDLLVANYPPTPFGASTVYYRMKMNQNSWEESDHFYENINGQYVDRTRESGLQNFGLTLSSTVVDFNMDGYPDIYLSNDFSAPDYLFVNNGDKTFREVARESTPHTAMYGMGSDAGDINNDGLPDLLQLDMSIQDNYRNKANMASMDIASFWNQVGFGLHYQYMQNVIQLNSGVKDSIPYFSDVARITGLSSTDWSWSVLSLDIDNDSYQDVLVTNGNRKEINNKDFFKKYDKQIPLLSGQQKVELSSQIPSQPIPNYLYHNNGDLDFSDISIESGLGDPSFSNGVAYSDLDNDGDLDLVMNNVDMKAFVYENRVGEQQAKNFIKVKLTGVQGNLAGIGSKVTVKCGGTNQVKEFQPARGYLSSVSQIMHFGIGSSTMVDQIEVLWADGTRSQLSDVEGNQLVELKKEQEAAPGNSELEDYQISKKDRLFTTLESSSILDHYHQENRFDDFKVQVLLPHKMSQFGPCLTIADFNGDGLEDIFVGGSAGNSASLFFQSAEGTFEKQGRDLFEQHKSTEDVDAIAFDLEMDGDLDLYIVSGGNEYAPGDSLYRDKLYVNNGRGQFTDGSDRLPNFSISGSVVKPFDFDRDGDLDLFVGGRHTPHNYPQATSSYLLVNEGGVLKDISPQKAPFLTGIGMVTDATWADFNGDKLTDLAIVGEWMEPVMAFQNEKGVFTVMDPDVTGLNNLSGWWFSVESSDLDGDGDPDLVLGNLGKNYKYQASMESPFKVFANDFDDSGSADIVLSYEQGGTYFPVRGRQCSSEQIPDIEKRFKDYNSFASADVDQIYGDMGLDQAIELEAQTFASVVLLNEGEGSFLVSELPAYAQISSINDILTEDIDGDQVIDLVLVGNLHVSEIETTRNDAGYGFFLKGLGDGTFDAMLPYSSGLFIKGDTKKVNQIIIGNEPLLVAARNNEQLSFHQINSSSLMQ